jgi:hypothetical protein
VWARLHRLVLDQLGQQGLLDWSRAAVDSVRAKRKGELTGPNPTDRGKAGIKYHVLCDRNGLPLHVLATAPTPTTARCSRHCWTPTPACGNATDRAGRGGVRSSCTPTRATTIRGVAAT